MRKRNCIGRKSLVWGAVAALALPATSALGAVIITDPGTHTLRNNGLGDYKGSIGYQFTVGASDVKVTSLGLYDAPGNAGSPSSGTVGDGLEASAAVALYRVDTNGANLGLVAGLTVPTGTGGTLLNGFRYSALGTPVTLTAGYTYQFMIGLDSGGNGFLNYSGGTSPVSPTISSDFTVSSTAYFNISGSSTNAKFHNDTRTGDAFVGPNMEYTVIPEPASAALIGVGAAGLLLNRRRR